MPPDTPPTRIGQPGNGTDADGNFMLYIGEEDPDNPGKVIWGVPFLNPIQGNQGPSTDPSGDLNPVPSTQGQAPSIADVYKTYGSPPDYRKGESAAAEVAILAEEAGYKPGEYDIVSGTGQYAGWLTWQVAGGDAPLDQTWATFEGNNGDTYMYNKEAGPGEINPQDGTYGGVHLVSKAVTETPTGPGVTQIDAETYPDGIPQPDGSVLKFYSVTDDQGRTSFEKVKEWPQLTKDSAIELANGGRLIPLGQGRYDYEPPVATGFSIDVEDPGNIVTIPGGQLIKTSPNQYQFVRETLEPGVKIDPAYPNRKFLQQPDGSWSELSPRVDSGIVTRGGRDFLQQYTGALSELAPRFDPGIQDVDGMSLLQQRSGAINQLTKPDLDQVITQALVDGEYDKAFAFQDFRDRPTASEAFQTALQFARSPADQVLISSIARGETAVQPPPPGQIQRVGPQPDFLVQAYQDFQRRTQAGRAPTPEEAAQGIARAEAGATPAKDLEIETLQARLERIQQDTANAQATHDAKMEQNNRSWQQLFDQKNTVNQINVAAAEAKANSSTTTATPTETLVLPPGANPNDYVQIDTTADGQAIYMLKTDLAARNARLGTDEQPPTEDAKKEDKEEKDGGQPPSVPGDPAQFRVGGAGGAVTTEAGLEALRTAALEEKKAAELTNVYSDVEEGGTKLRPSPLSPEEAAQRTARKEADLASFLFSPASVQQRATPSGSRNIRDLAEFISPSAQVQQRATPSESRTVRDLAEFISPSVPVQQKATPDRPMQLRSVPVQQKATPDRPMQLRSTQSRTKSSDLLPAFRAGGGTVGNKELTVVGEDGPEIAMFPTGTHILPLGKATKQDIRAAQATGRAYQTGGIVFGELPLGLRQLQAGRPITPSRGYLSRAAGLTLPSAQALQNLTPESLEVYGDLAARAGIPAGAFGQELRTTLPMGRRLPTSTMLPISRRGVR